MASLMFIIFSFASLSGSFAGATPVVPAIFVFGDSLADVGNNNYLKNSTARANFPHNGIDFPSHVPTGRFSNGYNTIDWIAKFAGYRQSPPPFLSLKNSAQMLRGVNFASGGSGILDTTGTAVLTFTSQVADFKTVVDKLVKQMGEERATRLLSKSLFLISAGSNDLFAYYTAAGSQNVTQNEHFVTALIDKFSSHMKTMYGYGARKFGVIGISHIGCVPAMTSQTPTGRCVEDLNRLARRFNRAAKPQMRHLESLLPGMKYSYGNVYDLMSLAFAKPSLFGYKNIKSACCGSGKLNGMNLCTPNATLCSNREQYLFWDRFHPTQATSKYTAMKLYSGSHRFAAPVNLKVLSMY